jgi:hypothetical protein
LELAWIAAYRGGEEAALDAGHGGRHELGWVCVGSELAAGFHAGEAVAEVGFPAVATAKNGNGKMAVSQVYFCRSQVDVLPVY